ncbi:MAG: CBS domain-containing protein [Nitrospira sp.]
MGQPDFQQPKTPNPKLTLVAHMMTPGVVQIPGDVSVTEAASLLEREQMPCLLVKDSDTRFGLMTPADIVKKVVAQGLEPDDIEVRSIMSRPVQFIEYDRAVDEASTLMMTSGTPILIVTKQEQPVGVLTARDLVLSPKRCHTRVSATISVMDSDSQGALHQATIVQLSHVGAMVQTPTLLLPGTKVVLAFSLPELATPLTVKGAILDNYDRSPARPTGQQGTPTVDVQFTGLSPADQSRIKAWVLQNSPKSTDLA